MGAGDMVAGGVRRAARGVRSVFTADSTAGSGDGAAAGETAVIDAGSGDVPADLDTAAAAGPGASSAPVAATDQRTDDVPSAGPGTAAPAGSKRPRTRSSAATAKGRSTARPGTPQADAVSMPQPDTGSAGSAGAPSAPTTPPVVEWSAEELAAFRAALDADIARLTEELQVGEADLADLVADSRDAAGDDQADSGAKTFEREHEMSVNANIREMLDQAQRAIQRLTAGTYGVCERCGGPIAAGRLRAFPRATLCIACKQAEERR